LSRWEPTPDTTGTYFANVGTAARSCVKVACASHVAIVAVEMFARLMAELAGVTVAPPLPNPPWVRWDHAGSGLRPGIGFPGNRDEGE
jgi:hypothetical protein